MRLLSWLRRSTDASTDRFSGSKRPAPRCRPHLEALDRRDLPSTLAVTNTLDDGSHTGSLRYAVAHAADGDTILLTAAAAKGAIGLTSGELLLTQHNLTIRSANPNKPVTVSGSNLSRVFDLAPGASVTLSDLAVTGGNGVANVGDDRTYAEGGAIVVGEGASLTLRGCSIFGNAAAFGGGVAVLEGSLAVGNSTLSGNSAYFGGGVYNSYGQVALTDSQLSGNSANSAADPTPYSDVPGFGGGMYSTGLVTVTLSNVRVTGNTAYNGGGGIYDGGFGTDGGLGVVTLDNGTCISDNSAYLGGGIGNDGMTLTVDGCTLDHNSAATAGGGIYNAGTLSVLDACQITHNTSEEDGGGVFNYGTLTIDASRLTDNAGTFSGGGLCNVGGTTTVTDTDVSNNAAGVVGAFYGDGGGIANFFGSLTLSGGQVCDNSAGFFGGGVLNYAGAMSLSGTTVSDNVGDIGGGVMNYAGRLLVADSLISSNDAFVGGGVYNYQALTTISNSTLTDNSASSSTNAGGGLYILGGTVNVENSSTITENHVTAGGLGIDVLNHGALNVDGTSTIGNIST